MPFAPDPKANKPQRHRVKPTLALRQFRLIASHHRAAATDRALALILAGIAGAANA